MVKQLGEGSQGAVFLGESPGRAPVAIKMLHPSVAADCEVRNRLRREAEIAASVAAFSTARVLETEFTEERPYIISEYVPGPSLERLVKEDGPRSGGGLERLAVTTLTALASIHGAGVVHRDFKPGNVIMGPEGPVVIDFGIALELNAGTNVAAPAGTPAYMSPEQFADQPLTPTSDMFSWAGTMVFAATGRPAFHRSTVPATMNAIFHAEPDLSGVPETLRRLVAACLAKDPAARPTAMEVLCDLVGGAPEPLHAVTAAPAGRGVQPAGRPPHRHRHRHRAESPARRHRRAAEGRHAASPALLTETPAIPSSHRRGRVSALAVGAALAVAAGTLFLTSVFDGPADAQCRQVDVSATVSECSARDAPPSSPTPEPSPAHRRNSTDLPTDGGRPSR
ncbi:serine/threonine-protein kinase [Sphaerisporangium dianthi]|uniref:Serine/threonine-protein kinase n=1 Tax=Sphaerisporangium dianthi TaxID=1436120 RepID=A0ABV9CJT7_9ACTN